MSQEYTITEVLSVNEAQYGKKRIAFKTEETGDRSLSCFTPYPETVEVGKKVFGDISEKIVNGKTFYNFNFGKKGEPSAPAVPPGKEPTLSEIKNILNLKVLPELEKFQSKINEGLAALDQIAHYLFSGDQK